MSDDLEIPACLRRAKCKPVKFDEPQKAFVEKGTDAARARKFEAIMLRFEKPKGVRRPSMKKALKIIDEERESRASKNNP